MRKHVIAAVLLGLLFLVAMLLCAPEAGSARCGDDEQPDLIIVFSGDVQGYLEDCG